MQLTAVIVLVASLHVAASGLSQSVTFSGKDVSLEKVFTAIRKQTGYFVAYKSSQLKESRPIDVEARAMDLQDFLVEVLRDQPLHFTIEGKTVFIRSAISEVPTPVLEVPEMQPIRGVVTDTTGMPLNGASITNKRTKKTVQTNVRGEFVIPAEEGDELTVSFIGFNKITWNTTNEFQNVILKASTSPLDEVQVKAYGTTSRRLGTGNISTVTAKEIAQQPINNPLFALAARVPGLEIVQTNGLPGGFVNVRIRGMNAGGTAGEPLYIVDGTPYVNNMATLGGPLGQANGLMSALSFLNPNDIESISVLKDADATSIYGSRGANGVIVITTKKGKAGNVRINATFQSGISNVARKLNLMNTQQYLAMRREAFRNDGIDPEQMDFKEFHYPDFFVFDTTKYTDWQEILIGNTGRFNDYQASVSGGTSNTQYIIGGTLHDEKTVYPGATKDQNAGMHFSINGSSDNQKFKASLTGSFLVNTKRYATDDFTKFVVLVPNAPDPYKADGTLNFGYDSTLNFYAFQSNPLIRLAKPFEASTGTLNSNASISYTLVKGFNLKTTAGYVEVKGKAFEVITNAASNPGTTLFGFDAPDLRVARYADIYSKSLIVEPQINYSGNIGRGSFNILTGGSYQHMNSGNRSIIGYGFISDALMKNSSSAMNLFHLNDDTEFKYAALFGSLNFTWDNKYIFNFNARRDGSSKFGPGKQFGNFGSAAVAWVFANEYWVKEKLPFISSGKIRSSYGTSGNAPGDNYAYLERYEVMPAYAVEYQNMRGVRTRGMFANDYHWESTSKFEVALEGGLFNDRILFQAAHYINRTTNRLTGLPLPEMAGPGYVTVNRNGLVDNKGIELLLQTTNIQSKNFTWNTSINFSKNKNRLVKDENLEKLGFPYNQLLGQQLDMSPYFSEAYVDPASGLYQFKTRDGELTSTPDYSLDNYEFIGLQPKFFGGISNTFTYKNFSVTVWLEYKKQTGRNYVFSFPQMPGEYDDAFGNQPLEVMDRWTGPNKPGKFQKFSQKRFSPETAAYGNAKNSISNFSDASYVRLKNLSVSYELPSTLKKRLGLNTLRLFANAQNLLTFTNYKGSDPESQIATNLPPLKVLTFGIQIEI